MLEILRFQYFADRGGQRHPVEDTQGTGYRHQESEMNKEPDYAVAVRGRAYLYLQEMKEVRFPQNLWKVAL